MMYGLNNTFDWGYGMMGGPFGGFMMIIFWVLLIMFVVWVVREVAGKHTDSTNSKALDILKERYARGEISKEEFEAKKKDIS